MALKRVDDIDNETIKDVKPVSFELDGVQYEIDLKPKNAKALRDYLKPYIAAGRPALPPRRRRRKRPA